MGFSRPLRSFRGTWLRWLRLLVVGSQDMMKVREQPLGDLHDAVVGLGAPGKPPASAGSIAKDSLWRSVSEGRAGQRR